MKKPLILFLVLIILMSGCTVSIDYDEDSSNDSSSSITGYMTANQNHEDNSQNEINEEFNDEDETEDILSDSEEVEENNIEELNDTNTNQTTPIILGGGGGSGGGGSPPNPNPTCTPSWSCTNWNNCSESGTQTRTCTDSNNCGTNDGKPVESQSCIYTLPNDVIGELINFENFTWQVFKRTEGTIYAEMNEHYINNSVYHTQQSSIGGSSIGLKLTNYQFQPGEILEYDANLVSGSGNHLIGFSINKDVNLSSDYNKEYHYGSWNSPAIDFGIYHYKLYFNSDSVDFEITQPNSSIIYSKDVCTTFYNNPKTPPYNFAFESLTGDNGLVHIDYNNFTISNFSIFNCSLDIDCEDYNIMTDDVCVNPGTVQSYCSNNIIRTKVLDLNFTGTGTTISDTSGYNNNGNITGASWVTDTYTALEFDKDTDFIKIPFSESINSSDMLSIEVLFKILQDHPDDWNTMIRKQSCYNMEFGSYGNSNKVSFGMSRGDALPSSEELLLDTWYHVVGTFDNDVYKLYINGELNATSDVESGIRTNNEDLYIGNWPIGGEWFNGRIGRVRIYNTALNSSEVTQSYNNIPKTCNINLDCNDNNATTEDICMNPGTLNSYCENNIIQQSWVYDDFSSGILNSSKWTESVGGGFNGYIDVHEVQDKTYYTRQDTPIDKSVLLTMNDFTLEAGDIIEFDVNFINGTGEHRLMMAKVGSGNDYCGIGDWATGAAPNTFGIYHFKATYSETTVLVNITGTDTHSCELTVTQPFIFGIETRTGSDGTVEASYDNFEITESN